MLVVRARRDDGVNQETWRRIGSSAGHAVQLEHTPKMLYERMSDDLRSERTASAWVGVFGVIALLLAALGAYGVLAQSVLQRTRELAVRSVLGATPTDLFAMVTAEAARLAIAGGVLGAASGVIAFRVVHAMFSTVSVLDIGPAAVAVALLAVAMSVATWIPARRAARLDPAALLRSD